MSCSENTEKIIDDLSERLAQCRARVSFTVSMSYIDAVELAGNKS